MVSTENEETLLYLELIAQPKQDNNIKLSAEHDARPPVRYNFTQFPFHKNAQKCITISQDRSWQLTNLFYHVLRVNYHFHLAIKINLLQLKNTHISDILVLACIFLGTPPCADIVASFQCMWVKTHNIQNNKDCVFYISW